MSLVPASPIQVVEMRVPMYCYGCKRNIRKALSHFKGLESVVIDFHQKKVSVTGMLDRDQILSAIKAKRKDAEFWSCKEVLGDDNNPAKPNDPSVKSNDPPAKAPRRRKRVTWAPQLTQD